MVRTPTRWRPASAPPARPGAKGAVVAPPAPDADAGAVEGSVAVTISAVKKAATATGAGSWALSARIRRNGATVFDRQTSLCFGADDDAAARDAECAAALRCELADVWRRVTRCEGPVLGAARAFDGARAFHLDARKAPRRRKWRWTCAARAAAPAAAFSRKAHSEFASEALAAPGAAASFRDELLAAWAQATRADDAPPAAGDRGDDGDDGDGGAAPRTPLAPVSGDVENAR